jgi:hypothetical protein
MRPRDHLLIFEINKLLANKREPPLTPRLPVAPMLVEIAALEDHRYPHRRRTLSISNSGRLTIC